MKFWTKLSRFSLSSRSSFLITLEVAVGILACILSLGIFVLFAKEILERDTIHLDQHISLFVYTLRTPWLTSVMLFITSLGARYLLILAALTGIIFSIKRHKKEAVLFGVALAMGTILNLFFKEVAQRPRPTFSPLVVETSFSFPSGHSMNAFIFYALIAYFSYHFFRNKKLAIVTSCFSAVIILLIGFSRIYLGVHYFTDVLAGYIAGFWWFVTILLVEHTLVFYRLFKQSE